MTYATRQDMIDRFGSDELMQLTDRANLGVIDDTALNSALADADAEINTYLVGRYTLPLASVSPILTRFAADIARYQLFDTRASDQVIQRYKDAIAFFKQITAGNASLGLDVVSVEIAGQGSDVQMVASPRVFSRGC
jgi:phage gp36-like protein